MASKFVVLLMICLFGLASCQEDEAREQLYSKVFKETEPKLERLEVIKMLEDLRELYNEDNKDSEDDGEYDEAKVNRIHQVLKDSEISESKCDKRYFMHTLTSTEYSGRANDLVNDSHRLQAELCFQLWEKSLLPAIATLSPADKETVSSIIKSMISANGGRDFEGKHLEMSYEKAQEGVIRFMEKKMGSSLSKKTKEDKFNEAFDRYISEPCGRIVGRLLPVADWYLDLSDRIESKIYKLDPNAIDWAKNALICRYLRGSGYTSSGNYFFQKDMFENLASRRSKSFW